MKSRQKLLVELKAKLVDKLFILVSGKTSQGVMDNFKEDAHCRKELNLLRKYLSEIDYANINPNKWTTDKEKNDQIKQSASQLQHQS